MQITGWVLTKWDVGDAANPFLPLVASMSLEWHGPVSSVGTTDFALVWVRCDTVQLGLIQATPT